MPAGGDAGWARYWDQQPRRAAQLRDQRPDVEVLPMRGNVETRLGKARGDDYDGAVLAAAGIGRLGIEDEVAEYLSPRDFVPAPGQGALAVQVRAGDSGVLELVAALEHEATRQAVTAERRLLELLGGGCQLPMGAYGRVHEGVMHLFGYLAWGEHDSLKCILSAVLIRMGWRQAVWQALIESGAPLFEGGAEQQASEQDG